MIFAATRGTSTAGALPCPVVNVSIPNVGFWNLTYIVNGKPFGGVAFAYGWAAGSLAIDVPSTTVAVDSIGTLSTVSVFAIPNTFDKFGKPATYASVALALAYLDANGNVTSTSTVVLQ